MITPKKIAAGILGTALFFLVFQFYLDSTRTAPPSDNSGKQVEIKGGSIVGYQKGRKDWELKADYIWAGANNPYLYNAEQVHNGKFFDSDGTIIIDNIQADFLQVNSKNKSVKAQNNISVIFVKHTKKPSKNAVFAYEEKEKRVSIQSDNLKYSSTQKISYLSDNVIITQGEATISTDRVKVDTDKNIAYINDPYTLTREDLEVQGNRMVIYIDEEYSELTNGIFGLRQGTPTDNEELDEREAAIKSKDTYLTCDRMRYMSQNDNDIIEIFGNIVISQDDKQIEGEQGYYNKEDEIFVIEENVKFKAESLDWLIKSEKRNRFDNPDIASSITQPIEVSANKLKFNSQKKELVLLGDIHISQEDKEAWCQRLQYIDDTSELVLSEKVKVKKENQDELTAKEIIVDINNETFDAKQQVSAEFKIKKNNSP